MIVLTSHFSGLIKCKATSKSTGDNGDVPLSKVTPHKRLKT